MEWLVKIGEANYKVESIETLKQWVQETRLRPEHYVFHPVLQKWMYAKDLEELRGIPFPAIAPAVAGTQKAKKKWGCAVLLAVVLLTVCVVLLLPAIFGRGTSSSSRSESRRVTSGAGVLRAPTSGTDVVVAVSEGALDEMLSAGNDRAIAALILGGRGFLVPQGTPVSVIDSGGLGKKKIIVTSGEMTGRTGWVPMEWVVNN